MTIHLGLPADDARSSRISAYHVVPLRRAILLQNFPGFHTDHQTAHPRLRRLYTRFDGILGLVVRKAAASHLGPWRRRGKEWGSMGKRMGGAAFEGARAGVGLTMFAKTGRAF